MSQNEKIFWKLMGKNIWKKRKNFLLFFMSPFLAATSIFVFVELRGILKDYVPKQDLLSTSLYEIMFQGIVIVLVMTVILMIMSLRSHEISRAKDDELLRVLGTSVKRRDRLRLAEYIGAMIAAWFAGGICGTIITLLFRAMLMHTDDIFSNLHLPYLENYFQATICCILLFTLALIINGEVLTEMNFNSAKNAIYKKSKLPPKAVCAVVIIGLIISGIGAGCYLSSRDFSEGKMYLYFFLAGTILIWYFTGAWWLITREEKEGRDLLKTVQWNPFYNRFHSRNFKMFLLFVLLFFIMFYYSMELIGNIPLKLSKKEYPYEFVWKLREDDEDAQKLIKGFEEKYNAEVQIIPAVNVVAMRGEEKTKNAYGDGEPGQNIGIPESAYKKFTGNSLDLNGEEIFIVYHQMVGDKAHPVDFSTYGGQKLHFGSAYANGGFFQNKESNFFRMYKVKGFERKNLLGYFGKGFNENVIVFSDEYFKKILAEEVQKDLEAKAYFDLNGVNNRLQASEGGELKIEKAEDYPDSMALIKVDDKYINGIEEELSLFENSMDAAKKVQYEYDLQVRMYYNSKNIIQENMTDRIMKFISNLFLFALLLFTAIYIIYTNIVNEMEEKKIEYNFLNCLGMQKERMFKMLLFEFDLFAYVPLVVSTICSIVFVSFLLRLRLFTAIEVVDFSKKLAVLWIIIWAIYSSFYMLFRRSVKKQVQ